MHYDCEIAENINGYINRMIGVSLFFLWETSKWEMIALLSCLMKQTCIHNILHSFNTSEMLHFDILIITDHCLAKISEY